MTRRHFIHTPSADETFGGPTTAGEHPRRDALQRRLEKLAKRLSVGHDWPAPAGGGMEPWENPGVPAGYAHLGELIALTFAPVPIQAGGAGGCSNGADRPAVLSLDVIYRGRELPISMGISPSDENDEAAATLSGIGDLFVSLHARTAGLLKTNLVAAAVRVGGESQSRIDYVARVLCENAFRLIVRSDFLPRVLHERIVELYRPPGADYLDVSSPDEPPIEFAHALRFLSVTHRPQGGVEASARAPLPDRWSRLFEVGDGAPDFSRRIGPALPEAKRGEWLNAADAGLWSVRALSLEIGERRREIVRLSPLLANDRERTARLKDWLGQHRAQTALDDADIEELSNDPPLLLYILFEAAHEMRGERLGVLGSVIVAEAIYKALKNPRFPGRMRTRQLAYSFEDLAKITFGRADLASLIRGCAPPVRSMPDLIRYLSAKG